MTLSLWRMFQLIGLVCVTLSVVMVLYRFLVPERTGTLTVSRRTARSKQGEAVIYGILAPGRDEIVFIDRPPYGTVDEVWATVSFSQRYAYANTPISPADKTRLYGGPITAEMEASFAAIRTYASESIDMDSILSSVDPKYPFQGATRRVPVPKTMARRLTDFANQ